MVEAQKSLGTVSAKHSLNLVEGQQVSSLTLVL